MGGAEIDRAVALIAGQQARPDRCIPYLGEQATGIRAELDELAVPWQDTAMVVRDGGDQVAGVALVDWDAEVGRGWVMGPWVDGGDDRWARWARPLVEAVRAQVPPGIDSFELSGHVDNLRLRRLAGELGWPAGEVNLALGVSREAVSAWPERSPTVTVAVRPAVPADLEMVGALHDAEFPGTYATAARLLEQATRGEVVALVAVGPGGAVVGYAAGRLQPDGEAYIDFVAVDPAARGTGTGRAMVVALARDLLGRSGADRVCLTVQDTRLPARALYESLGFQAEISIVGYRPAW